MKNKTFIEYIFISACALSSPGQCPPIDTKVKKPGLITQVYLPSCSSRRQEITRPVCITKRTQDQPGKLARPCIKDTKHKNKTEGITQWQSTCLSQVMPMFNMKFYTHTHLLIWGYKTGHKYEPHAIFISNNHIQKEQIN